MSPGNAGHAAAGLAFFPNNEEAEGDEHNIHTVREKLAVAMQSLWNGCQEVERLKECLAAGVTMLGATVEEAADARVAIMVT